MKKRVLLFLFLLPCFAFAAKGSRECLPDTVAHFTLDTAWVDSSGVFTFITRNESDSFMYVVQQYKWEKWLHVTGIRAEGKKGPTTYSCKVKLHGGINRFRVVTRNNQTDSATVFTWKPRNYGKISDWRPPGYIDNKLVFPVECDYQFYDQYGNVVLKGKAKEVDTHKLARGMYFLAVNENIFEVIRR